MSTTSIEWTDKTWNPVVGCSIVSKGCDNCYAMKMAGRLEAMGQEKYKGLTRKTESGRTIWTGKVSFSEKALLEPLSIKKPTKFFVDSMGDLFHEHVPFDWVDKVFAVMALTPQHTYQVLTKRAERMAEYLTSKGRIRAIYELVAEYCDVKAIDTPATFLPLPNVWLGTSIEDQKTADERIPHLLRVPAKVRFLSCEPLLGPIDLTKIKASSCSSYHPLESHPISSPDNPLISWVIVGGESGPKARPMHPDWVRSLRDQCEAAGVSFFFKQWGEWREVDEDSEELEHFDRIVNGLGNEGRPPCAIFMRKVGKKAAGNGLDGRVHLEFPV